ncbi:MAG: hypothetical protein EBS89_13645 [Proteobacteria bacterium]|nr:hypothetical protein [Pseudomonadota bacterium]
MGDAFKRLLEAGRGREGLRQACVDLFEDYDLIVCPEEMAEVVYDHFQGTEYGEQTWEVDGPSRSRIDYVMDRMRHYYVEREGWFSGDEWLLISEQVGDRVCEGVF